MLLTALFVAASLASTRSAAADPSVSAKQAEAQSVLAQIQEIDGQLSHAIEAYNLANVKLDRIKGELRTNSHHLTVARTSLKAAQAHLSARLVALYKGGGSGGTLEVILAAKSIDDLLNRIDTVDRVSEQDARVLRRGQELPRAGDRAAQARGCARAQKAAGRLVAERAPQQRSVDRGPARRAATAAVVDQE